jgi:hypothetical protein
MKRRRARRALRTSSFSLLIFRSERIRPEASFCSASSPRSMAMASSTSSSLVRRGSAPAASR